MVQPETSMQRFMKSRPAPYVGMALAAAMGILFIYFGFMTATCFGMMFGVLLYALPKSMGADTKKLVVFGIIFFIVSSVFAAYVVSKPAILAQEGAHDSGDFIDMEVTPFQMSDGAYVFTVTYTGDFDIDTDEIHMEYKEVASVWADSWGSGSNSVSVDPTGVDDNVYTFKIDDLKAWKLYCFRFVVVFGDNDLENAESSYVIGPLTMNDDDLTVFCLEWNFYGMGLNVMLIFFMILLLTAWMRRSLESTRERMEREGRLYPPGYGRCSECQTIVLPGEVVCRRCGAYIDIPDDMKVKKAEYFECSDCGKEVPAGADACPVCGALFDGTVEEEAREEQVQKVITQTFTCSECGKEVSEDAYVCPHCGERFED